MSKPQDHKSSHRLVSRSGCCGLVFISLLWLPCPAAAQVPEIWLGNSRTPPDVIAQGYSVTPHISQTATTTAISYTVKSPDTILAPTFVATVYYEVPVPGPNTSDITLTVNWSGSISVLGGGKAIPFFVAGSITGNTSNQQAINTTIQGGLGTFTIGCSSLMAETSTITLAINVGNASGGRKPYLNDFEGLGYADFTVWRPSDGSWYVNTPTSSSLPPPPVPWGLPGDVPVAGDYDGDGIADVAVFRPGQANWFYIESSTGEHVQTQWGLPGDIPLAGGDYDGDGKTDLAVWRPSTLSFYVLLSSTGAPAITPFGLPGDIPLVGNFDGDAKTDYAVYRPSEGNWYVLSSSTGTTTVRQWGLNGDIPVPGDYDRDGKTDYAVWRPSSGTWFVTYSASGQTSATQWGLPGDIPVPGDYSGDGLTDLGVWRPSEGNWYIFPNGAPNGNPPVQWGLPGDVPIGYTLTSVPAAQPGIDQDGGPTF